MKRKLTMLQIMKRSSRRYTSFKIMNFHEGFEIAKVYKVFKRMGKSVTELHVAESHFESNANLMTLSRFSTVREIHVRNLNLKKVSEGAATDLTNLRYLNIQDCDSNVISAFQPFVHLINFTMSLD